MDLGLDGGRVFVQVDAHRDQAAGDGGGRTRTGRGAQPRSRARARRAGLRQQHRAGPQVGPAANRDPLQRRAGAGGRELGREAVEQRRQPAQAHVREHGAHHRRGAGDQVVVHPAPSGPRQVGQPRPGRGEQIRRLLRHLPLARARPRLARPPGRLVEARRQRVVDRAENRDPRARQGDEMVLPRRPGPSLLRRLAHQHAQRRAPDRVGEAGQRGPRPDPRPQQSVGQRPVEAVHHGQGLLAPGDGLAQKIGAHHAAARDGAN